MRRRKREKIRPPPRRSTCESHPPDRQPVTEAGMRINEPLLIRAVDEKIRPLLIDQGYLDNVKEEGYQHKKVIPKARPHLSLESLRQDPAQGVSAALNASMNLLSRHERTPAKRFVEAQAPKELGDRTIALLYGEAPLFDRVHAFYEWCKPGPETGQGKTGINGTVISYLLAMSAPEKYAFCKPTVYTEAAKALLGPKQVQDEPVQRVVHCRDFYSAALKVLAEQPGLERLTDLMHTHIAFFLMISPPTTWEDIAHKQSPVRHWVFQGSPKQYRVTEAVAELDEHTWAVRQHKAEIRKGDQVFLWRSDPDAALLALGTLTSDPAVMSMDLSERAFVLPGADFSDSETNVRLRIDARIKPPILRQALLAHPVLGKLPVFKGQQGTNFALTKEEADALLDLIQKRSLPTLAKLAQELFLPLEFLEKIELLLQDKRQVIFFGPPGTGKTFCARKLAEYFAATTGGQVEKVQFHPSYAYEDFVQGLRPRTRDGQTVFKLVNGPLLRLAREAAKRPGSRNILLIDEINRGNIPKVFGELYFLLEYRDEEMRLQYGGSRRFKLPKDEFWIIGTMNTADRSIALVDAALRRRFHFVPFFPDEEPIKGLLERWLHTNRPEMVWVAGLVDRVNEMLDNRHLSIGPSHFLRPDLDREKLEMVWEYSVIPYLQEQFFGQEEKLEQFRLRKLLAQPGMATFPDSGEDAEHHPPAPDRLE